MKRLFAVAFGAAMVASACVVEVTYDPFGSDFAMSGEWTVDGLPASSATCGQIAQVRVVLYDAGTPFDYAQLMFPCAAGGFDTGRIFRYGNYDTEWQALDSSGRIIGRGARQVLDVGPPTELVLLTPADFTGAGTWDPFGSDWSMEGTWTVNGAPASGATCGAIADVRVILWHEGTFYSYADLTFPCSAGSFATDLIFQYGDYETQWQALDAGGAIIGEGAREDLIVNAPTTSAVLRPIDFEVVGGMGTMTVNIGWEDKATPDLFHPCGDPNAPATYDYVLRSGSASGPIVSEMQDIVCGLTGSAGIDFNNLPFGTYNLELHGFMGPPTRAEEWNGAGQLNHVTDGNEFDFDVPGI